MPAAAAEKRNPPPASPPRPPLPWPKRLLFAAIPLLVLATVLELGLRVAGFRYNPHDLRRNLFTIKEGVVTTSTFFTDNPRFSPPTFCLPQRFQLDKRPGELRVALLDGSSVFLLRDALPLCEQLEARLNRPVEAINMGVLGCGSERALWSAEEACQLGADVLLVYCGHNEFTSFSNPFTFHDLPLGSRWFARGSRTFQLAWRLADLGRHPIRLPDPERNSLRGRPFSDAEIEQIYDNFRRNLEGMIDAAQARGRKIVLATVAYNQQQPPQFTRGTVPKQQLLGMKDDQLRQLAAGPHGCSAASHLLGMRLLTAGNPAEGIKLIEDAYVKDPCPLQANRRVNAIIRDVAARRNVPLADVEAEVKAAAPAGLPGYNLFHDNCHLNAAGNDILMATCARAIGSLYDSQPARPKE
jgi:hypothetical protein